MDYIEYNVSQIVRKFGLNGTNLGRLLRSYYPDILEFQEKVRQRLGLDDHLQRGTTLITKSSIPEQWNCYVTNRISPYKKPMKSAESPILDWNNTFCSIIKI